MIEVSYEKWNCGESVVDLEGQEGRQREVRLFKEKPSDDFSLTLSAVQRSSKLH